MFIDAGFAQCCALTRFVCIRTPPDTVTHFASFTPALCRSVGRWLVGRVPLFSFVGVVGRHRNSTEKKFYNKYTTAAIVCPQIFSGLFALVHIRHTLTSFTLMENEVDSSYITSRWTNRSTIT